MLAQVLVQPLASAALWRTNVSHDRLNVLGGHLFLQRRLEIADSPYICAVSRYVRIRSICTVELLVGPGTVSDLASTLSRSSQLPCVRCREHWRRCSPDNILTSQEKICFLSTNSVPRQGSRIPSLGRKLFMMQTMNCTNRSF